MKELILETLKVYFHSEEIQRPWLYTGPIFGTRITIDGQLDLDEMADALAYILESKKFADRMKDTHV